MKLNFIPCVILAAVITAVPDAFGQEVKRFSQELVPIQGSVKMREYAALYYEMGDFKNALPLYEQLSRRYPGRIEFLYRTGVCYLYEPGGAPYAIGYLEKVLHLDPEREGLAFHLGKAFHANNDFDLGIKYFDHLLAKKTIAGTDRALIERLRKSCEVGKELAAKPLDVLIANMGEPLNTAATEYVPLLTDDESTLVFTYKMKKTDEGSGLQENNYTYDDIYISHKINGVWSKPESISDKINTADEDEAAVGLSGDGRKLFILKYSDETSGDIYSSDLVSGAWTAPVAVKGGVNTRSWEGSVSLTGNGKTLYFDSEREGGLGGTDIYRAELQADGSWGDVTSLGPVVNTPYNDEAAFICADGKTLYFSSDGHNTMGGFDIFKSTLDGKGNWSVPENLGYPINTTGNDKYYTASADQKRGYYHQNKPGGFGDLDLYMINYELPAAAGPVAAAAGGTVEDAPAEAKPKSIAEKSDAPAQAAAEPLTISGSVVKTGTAPHTLSNVKVRLMGRRSEKIAETTSDSKGNFSFTGLSGGGSYELQVALDDTHFPKPAAGASPVKAGSPEVRSDDKQPVSRTGNTSGELSVGPYSLCKSVEGRAPVGSSTVFSSDIGKVWFHTEVNLDAGDAAAITHRWYYGGREVAAVELPVQGPRWRTYSSKTIGSGMKGAWKVEAVSSDGKVLADAEFTVN